MYFEFSSRGRSNGHFSPDRWHNEKNDLQSEISLNPALLEESGETIMAYLVRLMVSAWQYQYGTYPSYGYGYCNQEFADKMREIGLPLSDTGEPGGNETGIRLSHYVDPEGAFIKSVKEMPESLFPWRGARIVAKPKPTRQKYACPMCGFSFMAAMKGKVKCFTEDCDSWMELQEKPDQPVTEETPKSKEETAA